MASYARTQRTSGWVYFAAVITLVLSVFNLLYGLVVLANDEWIALAPGTVVVFNLTTLGWLLLAVAAIQLVTGVGLLAGQLWAQAVAIAGATINAIFQMTWLSVYPLWSIIVIALDVLVIYAVAVHGDEVTRA